MTAREDGFLLLTSQLGNPDRKVLSVAQLRELARRVQTMTVAEPNRNLVETDLLALGYDRTMARRILMLLEEGELLEYYCIQGKKAGCFPLTRATAGYPAALRTKLGEDRPGCLWYKGDPAILNMPAIALAGSRELAERNRAFAGEVGRQAARQGFVLVSGNARGADQEAQQACLKAGGCVIAVVADALAGHSAKENVLYLSEEGFDQPFSAQRALSRNRVIHALGEKTFIAQCGYQTGGTWDGTMKNLRFGWSPVYCFRDGSPAQMLLEQTGAQSVGIGELRDFSALAEPIASLI